MILSEGYGLMPNKVLYDNGLSDKQKLLYCSISSLCAEKGYCWASNEYIGKLLGADKSTISRNISALQKKGYIDISISMGYARTITLCKNEKGGTQKCIGGDMQKGEDINTSSNNINYKVSNQENNIPKQEDNSKLGNDTAAAFEKYWSSYPRVRTRKKEVIQGLFNQLKPEEQQEIRKDALIYKIEYEQDSSTDKAKYVKGIDSYIKDYSIDDYREDKLVNIIKRNKQLREEGDADKRIKKFKQLYEVFGEDRCKELWIENTKSKVQDLIKGMGLN